MTLRPTEGDYTVPWEDFAKWAVGALVTVLSLLGLELRNRVKKLEEHQVDQDDIDELRTSMMATFMHGHGLLDKTIAQQELDRQRQHEQNRVLLQRMEQKLDIEQEKASTTRHAIKDEIHTLALSVAVLTRQEQDRKKERQGE